MTQAPAPQVDDLAAIRQELEALKRENAEFKAGQPKFVKMRQSVRPNQRTYVPPDVLRSRAMRSLQKGGEAGGSSRWLDTPQGRESLPPEYRPAFGPGDMVAINPEAEIFGGPVTLKDAAGKRVGDAPTWGALLDHLGLEGVGEVVATMGLTKTYEPKYKVLVQGLTAGFGGGWRESELLPYGE